MNELSLASQPEIIEPIVSARGLRKKFGRKEILHGLDFDIPPGRIYGLIGHNGAGKTTTLNAMLGLTNCEGTIRVLGEDPFAKRAKLMENVAFISDVASLPRFLRVRELFALLSNIHPNFSQDKARSFLEGTDIKPEMKIKHLSKGILPSCTWPWSWPSMPSCWCSTSRRWASTSPIASASTGGCWKTT